MTNPSIERPILKWKGTAPSRFLPLFVAGLSLAAHNLGCSRNHQSNGQRGEDHPSEELSPSFSAETWLRWDKSSRLAFVLGTLRGYSDGIAAGCFDARLEIKSLRIDGLTPQIVDEVSVNCGNGYKPSARALASYEKVVTDLYVRYPGDRVIEIPNVIQLIASDPGLTAEDVHKRIKITPAR